MSFFIGKLEKSFDRHLEFHQLFLIEIHAKCFQITRKTMVLLILMTTLVKCHCYLPWENQNQVPDNV